jgi:Transglycosylase SLT domain
MRRWQQLAIIASVAGWSLAAGPSAAAHAAAKTRGPHNVGARIERLIEENSASTETVRFAGRHSPPVNIVRGNSRPSGKPGTVVVVTFADSREPPVRVVRGGIGLSVAALAQDRILTPPKPSRADGEIVVAFADPRQAPVTVLRGNNGTALDLPDIGLFAPAGSLDLDRVAFAVDGAESSHGTDPGMWRPDPAGPQGPMQVSAAAAFDLGGGDRFDFGENRALGRAYLSRLYRRYGNWPDAIAAYNWGLGNLDEWIADGRPGDGLPLEVEHYRDHVLYEIGLQTAPVASRGK